MAEPNDWQDITDWEDVEGGQAPAQQAAAPDDWQAVTDWEPVTPQKPQPESSAGGAFMRSAARSVAPTLGSLPAIGAGAAAGGALGLMGGPAAPVTVPLGTLAGGALGGFGGSYLISKAQDWVLDKLGMAPDESQRQADVEQHPYASMAGELTPAALAFSPSKLAQSWASRAAGAGVMGGLEAGQEAAFDDHVDPAKVAMAAGFGAVFNKPTKLGERLLGSGAKFVRPGRPDLTPTPSSTQEKSEAGASVPPNVARGASESKPAPSQTDTTTGNPDSSPVRSAREYPKEAPASNTGGGLSTGQIAPDQLAALRNSVDKSAYSPPQQERAPQESLPLDTGIPKPAEPENTGPMAAASAAAKGKPPAPFEGGPPDLSGAGSARGNRPQRKPLDLAKVQKDAAKPITTAQPLDQSGIPTQRTMPAGEDVVAAARTNREVEQGVHERIRAQQTNEPLELTPEQQAHADRPAKPVAPAEEIDTGLLKKITDWKPIEAAPAEVTSAHGTPESLPLDTGIKTDAAAAQTNTKPTEAQKKSGKYKKGVAEVIPGVKVAIENPKGSVREGVGPDGKPWKVKMPQHYGEIEGTRGADGDKVDAFVGKGNRHFVIDQQHIHGGKAGEFDEHKVMINQTGPKEALETYVKAHDKNGIERVQNIREMSADELTKWLADRKATKKPVVQHPVEGETPPQEAKVFTPEEVKKVQEGANVPEPAKAAEVTAEPAPAEVAPTVAAPKPGRVRPTLSFGAEEPIKPVTAAVTRAESVQKAIDDARAAGMDKLADKLEAAPPGAATQIARQVRRKLGTVSVPEKVEGLGVTARSKADAARKQGALDAAKKAFDAWVPKDDAIPASAEEKTALRERLSGAVNEAREAYDGKNPLDYKPREKPAEWLWLNAAQRLLDAKSMSPKRIAEFIALEKQLRSGNAEDVANVRSTRRIDADIEKSRRPTSDEAQAAGAGAEDVRDVSEPAPVAPEKPTFESVRDSSKLYREVPKFPEPQRAYKEGVEAGLEGRDFNRTFSRQDVQASYDRGLQDGTGASRDAYRTAVKQPERELDLSKFTDVETLKADQEKVVQNIIATFDHKPEQGKRVLEDLTAPDWKKVEAERLAEQEARTEELKSLRAGRKAGKPAEPEVRKVTIDAETAAKALASLETASKRRDRTPENDPTRPPTLAEVAKDFLNSEDGSLNLKALNQAWRTRSRPVRDWIESTFGHPSTDMAYKVDSLMAQMVSTKQQLMNAHLRMLDADWHSFTKTTTPKNVHDFLNTLETVPAHDRGRFDSTLQARGMTPEMSKWMTDRAPVYRDLLDHAYARERQFGSTAEYVDNYVPHVFEDVKGARDFIHDRIKQLGPTWFQKERSFELISQAEAAGFKLKFKNPVDLITHRLAASEDMMLRVGLLEKMQDMGAAYPTKGAPKAANGWGKVVAPDHQEWKISPDVSHLWENAIEARGLWEADNVMGSAFRGWMKAKNAWVPVKLALSAFHMVHVVGVNLAEHIALGFSEKGFANKVSEVTQGLKKGITYPVLALPLEKLPMVGQYMPNAIKNFPGKQLRRAWDLPQNQMSPEQRLAVRLYQEAGSSPQLSEQLRVSASRDLASALAEKRYPAAVGNGLRRAIEAVQAPLFEEWIPNLKAAAMLRSTEALLRRDPSLINNPTGRRLALRAIGKSVDDRFGEMFYGSLFWNRYVKDASIGSMLSLGWNLGQFRQAGGAVQNLVTKTGGRGSAAQQQIYQATNKGAYVTSYVGTSMLAAGVMSYALSGQVPTGLDYFFPKAGGNNPDGSPRRLSTMFNTREVPMTMSHIQEQNSVVGGLMTLLWNKTVLTPITDWFTNRDFFGNQLGDPDAPWYKYYAQKIDSELGATFNPIAISGAKRAREQGGGDRDAALSYVGFGPAPSYISRSGMQNRIAHDYNQYVAPSARPYEQSGTGLVQGIYRWATDDPRQSQARRDARGALDRAVQQGDQAAAGEARKKLIATGMSPQTIAKLRPGESDVYMFSRLPVDVQKSLVRDMSQKEWQKFVLHNKQVGGKSRIALLKERGLNP